MKQPSSLLFATAGIPLCTEPRNTLNGISEVKRLGLDAMELEFVQSINVSKEMAPQVNGIREKEGVTLTCHGQYFVNLAAKEPEKIEASKKRIIAAATRLSECGGWSMCFHPAFYLGRPPESVYGIVKKNYQAVLDALDDAGVDVWVRPETTGKPTQFGDLLELCKLCADMDSDKALPCIDFAHLHARSNGKFNTTEEFRQQLELIEKHLGRKALDNMHIHIAGIEYSEKGERNHLPLAESDMNYKDLCKVWKEFKVKGVVVCESPIMEKDAMMLKKVYQAV